MAKAKRPLAVACDQAAALLRDAIRDMEATRDGRATVSRFYAANKSIYEASKIVDLLSYAFQEATDGGRREPTSDFVEIFLARRNSKRLASTAITPKED